MAPIIGDNIIMPIDMRTLETTRSIIRNGMKTRKPIWNAVFNSLTMKLGTTMVNGTWSTEVMSLSPAIDANNCRSLSRVWFSINCRSG